VILSYNYRADDRDPWQHLEYPVRIEWTRCNYGGARAWFRCPSRECDRRVAILYLGSIFACRHCYQLAYSCQREPPHYRAINRAQAILEKLGGSGNMCEPFPKKPKGMHWRTYARLFFAYKDEDAHCLPPSLRRLKARTPNAFQIATRGQRNNVL
jgi:hypothetical protein